MKFIQWLGKTVLTTLLVCALSIYTSYFVINMYVEKVLSQFNIKLSGGALQLPELISSMAGGVSGGLTGSGNNGNNGNSEDGKANPGSAEADGSVDGTNQSRDEGTNPSANQGTDQGGSNFGSGTGAEDSPVAGSGTEGATGGAGAFDEEAVEVWNQESGEQDEVVMSPDELQKKKDSLSFEEKAKVFELMQKKLPPEEMQRISGFMEDGITEAELGSVKELLAKYFTDAEYAELIVVFGG
ncbi:hypothetical protein SY83_06850 [Paenibacillus swuensis]|uniref:Uncharacterized protein n=1 Tax=Paenibacillus swuensis TaxID=1178515 RepID=A0A172TG62_9BACL|nr:hypothetical protein [Paenibacillus swuensis]ANE46049.1 hypothetical protein SY83_06850 [Paenibacillus swuensis]